MSLTTYSAFIYGHDITENNQWINFSENGIDEISAQIEIGSYTLTQFVAVVLTAMNEAGGQEYTASLDRTTRKITIQADSNFELWVTTGTQTEISAFELMGFTLDKSGSNSYEADTSSGSYYEPQYWLQSYVDFEDYQTAQDSTVNESASGIVEVVSFGENKFMECNITFCTDIVGQGVIKDNANGVADLRAFMLYATTKKPLEFIADANNANIYVPAILEKTQVDSKGTGFKLYELYARGLANYFETKNLMFRQIAE